MAGALVGGAFLSASLQVLFDRISSREVVDVIRGKRLNDDLLKKLEIVLLSVNAVVDDAEEKQIKNLNVKKWLDELKDAVYRAEDLLEEISTEALRCQIEAESQSHVTKFFSSFNLFKKDMNSKMEEVLARLEFIAKQKDVLGLREYFAEKPSRKFEETSIVDESGVYGRDVEKASLVEVLLSDASTAPNTGVVAVVGLGGIGKTTLARLVYNHHTLKECFGFRAWVCVSDEFDIFRVSKAILDQVTSWPDSNEKEQVKSSVNDTKDLETLQLMLMQNLSGKKFLLVLDDVWSENPFEWEKLLTCLNVGLNGSKIIVTTRNERVASVARAASIHYLNVLSDNDCWSLFSRHAFNTDADSRAPSTAETTRKAILKRCKGLPLAAKALGSLLRVKSTPMEWEEILKSEIWEFSDFVIPALRISYLHLPSQVKRCFAHCAVFPKDYQFEKKQLIELWMAENLLHHHAKGQRMEELGERYFNDLVSRSLIHRSNSRKLSYVMHDLVHDLAKFVSGEFCFWVQGDGSHGITEKARHLSYSQSIYDSFNKFEGISGLKHLRTFLPFPPSSGFSLGLSNKVLNNVLPTFEGLRVLSLSGYRLTGALPDSIGNFKYLRLLDLSHTAIQCLPNSTCTLYNLMILKLSYCRKLAELPSEMHKLRNLSHLDLTGTNMKKMPVQMSKLRSLQTLTFFSVGNTAGTSIRELAKLNKLRGKLSILELQNVNSPMDALNACLKNKKHLDGLCLKWSTDSGDSQKEREMLEKLQPHANLKELTVENYGGTAFPSWLENQPLSHIVLLCLSNCKYCISLPPLGSLRSLKDLSVTGFDSVVKVGSEFYGSGGSAIDQFESLEILRFKKMPAWEEWLTFEQSGAFPRLLELHVENCPKLRRHLPKKLPSLKKLLVSECPHLIASLPRVPALRHLKLGYCDKLRLKNLPRKLKDLKLEGWSLSDRMEVAATHLTTLKTLEIYDSLSFTWNTMDHLSAQLKVLVIKSSPDLKFPIHLYYASLERLSIESSCHSLRNLPLDIFPNLKDLTIRDCISMESLSVLSRPYCDLISLTSLRIVRCPNFILFPEGGLRAPNLASLAIIGCQLLKSLPESMHTLLPSLQYLCIKQCPQIMSFPDGGMPSKLESLSIFKCERLITNRAQWDLHRLSCLRNVSFGTESRIISSIPEEGLLPTTLAGLQLFEFPCLKSLNSKGLHQLTKLKQLIIVDCPQLQCLPEDGLPKSLSTLATQNCPMLKKRCQGERGEDWSKISHIPCIQIDGEVFP